jgi:ABC-type transporter Mla subunit MlaD
VTTLQAIAAQRPALAALLDQLPPTLAQMRGSFGRLGTTLDDIQPALRALVPTAHALPVGLRALKRFAAPALPALRALDPALVALNPFAKQLKPTASALQGALARLAPQIPRFNLITSKLVPCELPVDKFFAYTLSVFKFGNSTDLTSAPRGVLVADTQDNGASKDPLLVPAIGCADGKAPPDDQG